MGEICIFSKMFSNWEFFCQNNFHILINTYILTNLGKIQIFFLKFKHDFQCKYVAYLTDHWLSISRYYDQIILVPSIQHMLFSHFNCACKRGGVYLIIIRDSPWYILFENSQTNDTLLCQILRCILLFGTKEYTAEKF